jgi:putative endonuclease
MFVVYVLISQTSGLRYVGQTSDLEKRLNDHNSGESRYTKNRGPWNLAHKESYQTRSEAMRREKFFKTGKGRDFLDKIINEQ